MCGIVGKVCPDEPIDRLLIDRMCRVIEHRGPDSRGTFIDRGVGLGVQRLAVIDLETGDQPIFNENRSVVVVLNGEIYNYRELRASLTDSGHRFNTQSDTEVIVHLYEDHGDDCVRMLRGMFGFALWDIPRQRLLLARDRIGKKPLYYSVAGKRFWFASESKAILQDPAISRDIDPSAIDAFLHFKYVPAPKSAFASLATLPAGHTLTFEAGRMKQSHYWKLSYATQPLLSDDESCELIRKNLLEATRLRLRSDVPLGIFLSGGVDSSAVVAAAAQQTDRRLTTFTIGFSDARFDEREYARQVARRYDTDHHELVVEPNILEVLPRLAWHYGEPFADQSAVPSFYLAELARRHVTVALNGDGGDESFGGYFRYVGNDVAMRLAWTPATAARVAQAALEWLGTGDREDTRRARMLRLSRALQLDAPGRYASWIACFNRKERLALYTEGFSEQVRDALTEEVVRAPFLTSDASTLIERLLDVDTQTFLPGQFLVKMDIASMAHSLEVRSPFLDHCLMEMAATLPLSAKVVGRTGKHLLKEAVRPWLPSELLDRPKRGFSMPVRAWFRDELRELPATILLDARARGRGLFEARNVERLIRDHQRGRADHAEKLWALVQLELWFRTFVDVMPTGPIALDLGEVSPGSGLRRSVAAASD